MNKNFQTMMLNESIKRTRKINEKSKEIKANLKKEKLKASMIKVNHKRKSSTTKTKEDIQIMAFKNITITIKIKNNLTWCRNMVHILIQVWVRLFNNNNLIKTITQCNIHTAKISKTISTPIQTCINKYLTNKWWTINNSMLNQLWDIILHQCSNNSNFFLITSIFSHNIKNP